MWYWIRVRDVNMNWYICVHAQSLSCVQYFVTLWTVAHQAPLSMGFFTQEYWSGLSFAPPGDRPDSGLKPSSPELQVDFLPTSPSYIYIHVYIKRSTHICVYIERNNYRYMCICGLVYIHILLSSVHWAGLEVMLPKSNKHIQILVSFFIVQLSLFIYFFYWRTIALQNFVVFCQTSTWIGHGYMYIPSLLNLPPISLPIPPL